jgi:catechol 2,3-dioxygenase-like lactoylglutathione lyase family enzyme
MIDHIGIAVSDLARSKAFYVAALAPIGYSVLMEFPDAVGLGTNGKPDLWLAHGGATKPPIHLALVAERRAQIDAFHAAAVAAGGTDNGGPGLRPHYHPNYYAAFVLDPDGNNLEIVKHAPE